jgi:hypothetical protein
MDADQHEVTTVLWQATAFAAACFLHISTPKNSARKEFKHDDYADS